MDYRPWIIAHHALLSVEFSRQSTGMGYHSNGLQDHPDPRIEPTSLASPALVGRFFATAPPENPGQGHTLRVGD